MVCRTVEHNNVPCEILQGGNDKSGRAVRASLLIWLTYHMQVKAISHVGNCRPYYKIIAAFSKKVMFVE